MKTLIIFILMFFLIPYNYCISQESDVDLFNSGLEELYNGNYNEAIKIFTAFIEKYPTHKYLDKVYNSRGLAYYNLKKYSNAISDYDSAIELNPYNALAYNNRGVAKQEPKLYPEVVDIVGALEDYTKAIEIDPKFATAYKNRGMLYYFMLMYEKAISDFENAIKYNYDYEFELRPLINEMKSK